jgi:hypothetical protein
MLTLLLQIVYLVFLISPSSSHCIPSISSIHIFMMTQQPNSETNTNGSSSSSTSRSNPRSCILQVGACAGHLCGVANTHLAAAESNSTTTTVLVLSMSELLKALMETASSLHLDLSLAIRSKVALNNRKYPAELCKVRDIDTTVTLCVCVVCVIAFDRWSQTKTNQSDI